MTKNYIHLHTHSDYSPQDGAQSVTQIAEKAAKLGMPSVALTDHGRAGGLLQFKKACEKSKIKPIYGIELYVAPKERTLREKLKDHIKTSYHLTVLAQNEEGLKNIFRLSSKSWREGTYYGKPRVDMELLREHSEGLIVPSGCGSSRLSVYIMEGRLKEAVDHVREMLDIYGDRFYIEVQNHGINWQEPLKAQLVAIANKLSIPVVATQDSHYPNKEDGDLHNHICKLTSGDLTFDSDQNYFKSREEMEKMFPEKEHLFLDETLNVANRCNCNWEFGQTIWPVYDLKETTPEEELKRLTNEGFKKLYGEGTKEYHDRLKYELRIIKEMGFPTYFLIVQDFINYAKSQGIPVGPGRGSGAGSLVCYCLGITNVDPIKYGLYFERFLNPARVSLPDLDIDFCKERRVEVIQYMADKYGQDYIAQIGTYAVFKPRGSLRAFARVCGEAPIVGDKLANLVPADIAGKQPTFEDLLENVPEMSNSPHDRIIKLAVKAEGLRMQTGVHAAGIVVADRPINELLPLFAGKHKEIATQFDMHDVEDIGLVKFDFLGLKNLTVIAETLALIKKNYDIDIDIEAIEDEDKETYELFKNGNLDGIFQFETSSGFRDLCMKVRPKTIEDLSVITSLFRPGPLRTGAVDEYVKGRNGEEPEYSIPELKPILESTYGVMCYQEQIMKICTDVAGYTLAEADNMRKIIGKKLPEKMKLEREKFVSGCVANKTEEKKATKLFNDIEGFAEYSFNKSHGVAYSLISYRTAWLKAHYPTELYTALMNNSLADQDKIVKYIHSAKELEIPLSPPDINRSQAKFTLDNKTILFGLSGVKGIGVKACDQLIEIRPKEGFDTLDNLILAKIKKNIITALAECGALEEITSLERWQIVEHLPELIDYHKKIEKYNDRAIRIKEREAEILKAVEDGKKPPRKLPKLKERPEKPKIESGESLSRAERLKLERKTLGFYLTGHPLADYPRLLEMAQYTIEDVKEGKIKNKEFVKLPVVVSSCIKKRSAKKQDYAVLTIEDMTGRIEVTVFPKTWQKIGKEIEEAQINIITCRVGIIEQDDGPPVVNMILQNIVKSSVGLETMTNISVRLKDSTLVTFIPRKDCDYNNWKQASSYAANLKRMN